MQVLTLTLIYRNQLFVEYLMLPGEPRAYVLPLDLKIGNHEGQFDIHGKNFSHSARDVVLHGTILYAKLCTSSGEWWADQIAIDITAPTNSNSGENPLIRFRRCERPSLESCHSLRLIDGFLLMAECLDDSGRYIESYLDLEKYLGIKEGVFDKRGIYFLGGVNNVHLNGTTLCANLKKIHRPITINLSCLLEFKSGVMTPLKETDSENLENELLIDASLTRHWLPNARNIRLLSYKKKREWYLIAECLTPRGSFRESVIKLHEIIGPHDGELFSYPIFASARVPQHARDTRLADGMLTASFDAKDGKWIQRSFDLAELVSNEGGTLSM